MSGTREGANTVMISQWNSAGYNDSYLQAKLSAGQSWSIPEIPTATVRVDSIGDRAEISIDLNLPPTTSPTQSPNPCGTDSVFLMIDVLTDNWPFETDWTLTDTTTGSVLLEEPSDLDDDTLYTQEVCAPAGHCFEFKITDTYGDGICCSQGPGYYKFYTPGELIAEGGEFDYSETVTYCDTIDSPTVSPTKTPTRSPTTSPTLSPTGSPTTAPTLSPTLPLPTGSPTVPCVDALFPMAFTDYGESAIECSFISAFSDCLCSDPVVQSHCPLACDSCETNRCLDSNAAWVTPQGSVLTCAALAGFEDLDFYCSNAPQLSATCPATCGVCD